MLFDKQKAVEFWMRQREENLSVPTSVDDQVPPRNQKDSEPKLESTAQTIFDRLKADIISQFYVSEEGREGALGLSFAYEQIDIVSNEIIMMLIADWVQSDPQFQNTLNGFFEKNDKSHTNEESIDSCLQVYKRTHKRYRQKNNDFRCQSRAIGVDAPDPVIVESSRRGYPLSIVNYEAIRNMSSENTLTYPLLNSLVSRRIVSTKKVSNTVFVDYYNDYEKWCDLLKTIHDDYDFLIHSIDFFSLQEKLMIDFMVQLGVFMDTNDISVFPRKNVELMCTRYWALNPFNNNALVSSEFFGIFSPDYIIPMIFETNPEIMKRVLNRVGCLRVDKAIIFCKLKQCGIQDKFTVPDAADFLRRNFDILHSRQKGEVTKGGKPNHRRIRMICTVMDEMLDDVK